MVIQHDFISLTTTLQTTNSTNVIIKMILSNIAPNLSIKTEDGDNSGAFNTLGI